jgi:hypothetical protein
MGGGLVQLIISQEPVTWWCLLFMLLKSLPSAKSNRIHFTPNQHKHILNTQQNFLNIALFAKAKEQRPTFHANSWHLLFMFSLEQKKTGSFFLER